MIRASVKVITEPAGKRLIKRAFSRRAWTLVSLLLLVHLRSDFATPFFSARRRNKNMEIKEIIYLFVCLLICLLPRCIHA